MNYVLVRVSFKSNFDVACYHNRTITVAPVRLDFTGYLTYIVRKFVNKTK